MSFHQIACYADSYEAGNIKFVNSETERISEFGRTSVSQQKPTSLWDSGNQKLPGKQSRGGEESFNDWGGGRGCHNFVPVLGGDGTKIAPPGGIFDQTPGEMS